jgi:hypothetical protein
MTTTMWSEEQQRELTSTAGVQPCAEWLQAAQEHIIAGTNNNNNGGTTTSTSRLRAEDVLHQIVHSDLHHVVGESSRSDSSTQLRQALERSLQQPSPPPQQQPQQQQLPTGAGASAASPPQWCKATLPDNFVHMVQVEELLDVSLNARDRLQFGPAGTNQPTPIGNQRKRCLKYLISDGYSRQGSSGSGSGVDHITSSTSNNNNVPLPPIIGVAIYPIANLSVQSNAGIKLLLKGPMDIRYGVLLLHEGNCFVMGGAIESLKQIQRQAIEQARKVAGVGTDPTIQALINHGMDDITNRQSNMDGDGDGGDEEEQGYGESRDVAPSASLTNGNTNNSNSSGSGSGPLSTMFAAQSNNGTAYTSSSSNNMDMAPPPPQPPSTSSNTSNAFSSFSATTAPTNFGNNDSSTGSSRPGRNTSSSSTRTSIGSIVGSSSMIQFQSTAASSRARPSSAYTPPPMTAAAAAPAPASAAPPSTSSNSTGSSTTPFNPYQRRTTTTTTTTQSFSTPSTSSSSFGQRNSANVNVNVNSNNQHVVTSTNSRNPYQQPLSRQQSQPQHQPHQAQHPPSTLPIASARVEVVPSISAPPTPPTALFLSNNNSSSSFSMPAPTPGPGPPRRVPSSTSTVAISYGCSTTPIHAPMTAPANNARPVRRHASITNTANNSNTNGNDNTSTSIPLQDEIEIMNITSDTGSNNDQTDTSTATSRNLRAPTPMDCVSSNPYIITTGNNGSAGAAAAAPKASPPLPLSPMSKVLYQHSRNRRDPSSAAAATLSSGTTPPTTKIPLLFTELKELLRKLHETRDRALYESHFHQSEFVVPSKLGTTRDGQGIHFYFNLEKISKKSPHHNKTPSKHGGKKEARVSMFHLSSLCPLRLTDCAFLMVHTYILMYCTYFLFPLFPFRFFARAALVLFVLRQFEYLIRSAWAGTNDSDGFITSKICTTLLIPFFGISPVSTAIAVQLLFVAN